MLNISKVWVALYCHKLARQCTWSGYGIETFSWFVSLEPAEGIVVFHVTGLDKSLRAFFPYRLFLTCGRRMAVQFLLILLVGVYVSYRGSSYRLIILWVALFVLVFVRDHHEGIHRVWCFRCRRRVASFLVIVPSGCVSWSVLICVFWMELLWRLTAISRHLSFVMAVVFWLELASASSKRGGGFREKVREADSNDGPGEQLASNRVKSSLFGHGFFDIISRWNVKIDGGHDWSDGSDWV